MEDCRLPIDWKLANSRKNENEMMTTFFMMAYFSDRSSSVSNFGRGVVALAALDGGETTNTS